jgi:hypothetical protein
MNAVAAHVVLGAEEGPILSDHHTWNLIQHDRAAAHGAGRESRINGAGLVDLRRQPARVAEAIHLSMINRATALNATVVPAADDLSLMHEDRSNRNAALGEALLGLLESGLEIGIRMGYLAPICRRTASCRRCTRPSKHRR